MTTDAVEVEPVRVVGQRVDWLEIAYAIEPSPAALEILRAAAREANEHSAAMVAIGEVVGRLHRTAAGRDRWIVSNNDLTIVVDCGRDVQGWCVVLRWHAMTLARSSLSSLIDRARELARCIGAPREGAGERVRRLDLAVDFGGWVISEADCNAFVGRALRAAGMGSVSDFRAASADEHDALERRTYHAGPKVTGVTICAGSPLQLRVYDKRAQLAALGDVDRTKDEHARWIAGGWNGSDPVTRVEAQIRGEVLREFTIGGAEAEQQSARAPCQLPRLIDSIWAYVTCVWVRLVLPDTATRLSRCELDPRWELARSIRFEHAQCELVRKRHRRGADLGGALGSMLSFSASHGRTYPIAIAPSMIDTLEHTHRAIALVLEATAWEFADLATLHSCSAGGANGPDERHAHAIGILQGIVSKRNAAFARFWCDAAGVECPPPVVPQWWQEPAPQTAEGPA